VGLARRPRSHNPFDLTARQGAGFEASLGFEQMGMTA